MNIDKLSRAFAQAFADWAFTPDRILSEEAIDAGHALCEAYGIEPTPAALKEPDDIVAASLVAGIVAAGYYTSVYNGEEMVVKQSNDFAEIVRSLHSTDVDYLRLFQGEHHRRYIGCITLAWGADDFIAEYSASLNNLGLGL